MGDPIKYSASVNKIENWQTKCSSLKERLAYAVNNEEFSDVVFLVGPSKEVIRCNKFILCISSPVFETMFSTRWEPNEMEIQVPDVESGPFRAFLKVN